VNAHGLSTHMQRTCNRRQQQHPTRLRYLRLHRVSQNSLFLRPDSCRHCKL
jgi:hypothetical protein